MTHVGKGGVRYNRIRIKHIHISNLWPSGVVCHVGARGGSWQFPEKGTPASVRRRKSDRKGAPSSTQTSCARTLRPAIRIPLEVPSKEYAGFTIEFEPLVKNQGRFIFPSDQNSRNGGLVGEPHRIRSSTIALPMSLSRASHTNQGLRTRISLSFYLRPRTEFLNSTELFGVLSLEESDGARPSNLSRICSRYIVALKLSFSYSDMGVLLCRRNKV